MERLGALIRRLAADTSAGRARKLRLAERNDLHKMCRRFYNDIRTKPDRNYRDIVADQGGASLGTSAGRNAGRTSRACLRA